MSNAITIPTATAAPALHHYRVAEVASFNEAGRLIRARFVVVNATSSDAARQIARDERGLSDQYGLEVQTLFEISHRGFSTCDFAAVEEDAREIATTVYKLPEDKHLRVAPWVVPPRRIR